MDVVRTTTLALGVSLIGSSLFIVLDRPTSLSLIILATGAVFLLHGTGFLQEYMVRKFLIWYRTKRPCIGIISDLPWPEKGSHGWAWSKMKPEEWSSEINRVLKTERIKAKVDLIKITSPWTRWFLDRYLVVLNPYGSIYPEINIEELAIMRLMLRFIHNGGIFVNVADIPFFFSYSPEKSIMYCPTRMDQVHLYKYQIRHLRESIGHGQGYIEPYPSFDSPFSREAMLDIIATEIRENEQIIPMRATLKLKDSGDSVDGVPVNRGIRCSGHVESLIEELEWDGRMLTPLCYVHYGKGKALFSLIFLESDEQEDQVREIVTKLQCSLIVREARDSRLRVMSRQ